MSALQFSDFIEKDGSQINKDQLMQFLKIYLSESEMLESIMFSYMQKDP
jgi:hypothetical protein